MLPNLKLSYYNFYIPHAERDLYIVYNSAANTMLQLDWETGSKLHYLNSAEIHHLPVETIEMLKRNKMIIPFQENELLNIRGRADDSRASLEKDSTLFLLFSPTNMCNMTCPYCYQGDKGAASQDAKRISKENISEIKSFFLERLNNPHSEPIKKVYIEWFGGEPLLHKQIIDELSEFILNEVDSRGLEYEGHIITNAYLLDEDTWSLLETHRIFNVQVTFDGNKELHDRIRRLISNKGSYEKILHNLTLLNNPQFNITIRINGDKDVFAVISDLFDDFAENKIWPHKSNQIGFHWAPKFYNFLGHNQEKNVYYTSYEYQKSREDFAKLRLTKYNQWAKSNNKKTKTLKQAYPTPAKFYCNTVESPNSFSLDSGAYIHKCYNTVNDKSKRIAHISEFKEHGEAYNEYKNFDKTNYPECSTCKVLPICEENCNMRFLSNAESKICTAWKFFMNERVISIYEQNFIEEDSLTSLEPTII